MWLRVRHLLNYGPPSNRKCLLGKHKGLSTEELLFIYCIYSFLFLLTMQSTSDYKSHLSIIHNIEFIYIFIYILYIIYFIFILSTLSTSSTSHPWAV